MPLSPPLSASAGAASEALVENRRRWTERDEERLLRAALEIAEEAAEAFDPSVPLFARLGRDLLGSPFTGDEILSKIRELRRRYEEKRYKILVGAAVGDFKVAAFEISNRIWGDGIAGAVTKKSSRREMRTGFLLLLSLAFVGVPAGALYSASSPVVQLNPSNFNSKVLNAKGVVLVEFFAPWCGHCQALTPTWEKAATVLKGVATVAALDADAHKSLAQEYGIKGFPTIKVFSPGKPPVDYQGARDVKPIAEFALQQIKALLKERLSGKSSGGSSEKSETNARKYAFGKMLVICSDTIKDIRGAEQFWWKQSHLLRALPAC